MATNYREQERRIFESGEHVINFEISYIKNEKQYWNIVTKVPLRDSEGQITGLIGVNRDITERKAIEDNLLAERTLLRTLIEAIPDAIYLKDTEGRFLLANRTCWLSEGFSSMEALIGKTDFDFIEPERAKMHREEERQIIETGEPLINAVMRYINREEAASFVMITKVPLYDTNGERVGIIGINRDINENIRNEIQMSYQSTLVKNISDAVISTDLSFSILGWNPGAEKLYGWKAEEVIGKKVNDLIPIKQSLQSVQAMREMLETTGSWSGEVIHPRKDGSEVDIFSSVSLVYDNEGIPVGSVGINHDITEQKVAEKQRLELAVERERVGILRRFIGDMSHDLRNPLATIKVSLYLLHRLVDNPDRRTYHLGTLELQINRLENMVNDLLSMANLDSEASEFIFIEVDLSQTVYEVVTHQESLAARREQKLTFEAEKDLPPVRCDEGMLIRALTNLVANALNYTPVGGEVSVHVLRQEENIHIRIRDTGIGIDPADLPHIFERFYRADKARSTDTGGTGLGLSITQRIIEAHDGEITVESEPGQGSTFTIILPSIQPG